MLMLRPAASVAAIARTIIFLAVLVEMFIVTPVLVVTPILVNDQRGRFGLMFFKKSVVALRRCLEAVLSI